MSAKPRTAEETALQPPLVKDPYAYTAADIEQPPTSFGGMLKRIGPGIILSASIVGSGELIATTNLGAEVGYVALWVIIISCFIKPVVQSELGRYTIATGQTGLAGFNEVPGPRLLKVNWIVWLWAMMVLLTMFQIGAMFGGVAQVLNQLMPSIAVNMWVPVLAVITLGLLLSGGYERVEKLATIKVGLFTMLTFMCALMLTGKPEYFSWDKLAEGLSFKLPPQGLASAVAVFGITGVGAAELFMYPYWCVEKGYARYTGPKETAGWRGRALGWVSVMNLDILASMVIYTVATVAFYLLGAGVLHSQGLVPKANDMIPVLSKMYTQTLGGWSVGLFYLGAVATLYGTIFAATAANSRVYADMMRLLGFFPSGDYAARVRWRNGFVWALIVIPVGFFYWAQSPVWMVKLGGVAQASMLPVIAVGTLFLRFRRTPDEVKPGLVTTVGLIGASIVIWAALVYSIMVSQA